MNDRDLRVSEFVKLMRALGCEAEINQNNFVKVRRKVGGVVLTWSQHAHKGRHDSFRRSIVRHARRKLDFENTPDDEFYLPLD